MPGFNKAQKITSQKDRKQIHSLGSQKMKIAKTLSIIIFPFFLGIVLTTNSCTYKNAQDVYPVDTLGCYRPNISFANDIVPILVANCYSCHSNANKSLGSGYVLEGYANDTLYVKSGPGTPDLYTNVSDANVTDFYHMPKGLPSISGCEISKIKAWIDQGYKNN